MELNLFRAATLAGTLQVELSGNATSADQIPLMTFASSSGNFVSVNIQVNSQVSNAYEILKTSTSLYLQQKSNLSETSSTHLLQYSSFSILAPHFLFLAIIALF